MLDLEAAQDPYLEEYKSARDKLRTAEMPQALDKLNDLANRGSVMSLLLIADALRVGRLYNQDLVGAAEWYRVAVEAGWPRAHYGLAQTFHRMKRDDDAIKLFEQACAMEYGPAFNFLGILYWHGRGVPVDRHKALALFRRGAAFQHIPSKVNLA
jgi:TPR repeat protein